MKKNTASQVIGAQMISAADGSAFTDSVTVAVTGNGGTQATGSVGSGACTHEGNGFHTYAPAQAETNYDHVAFTFTGSGAIPVTIQVYPAIPTVDANVVEWLGEAPDELESSADLIAAMFTEDSGETYSSAAAGSVVKEIADNAGGSELSVEAIAEGVRTELADELAAIGDTPGALDAVGTALGTPTDLGGGATIAANLVAIESQTDDIGVAGAGLSAIPTIATVTNLTNAPTNGDLTAAMKASVNSEVDAAIETYHLDHLLAATYDPASKPGNAGGLLNVLVENDGGVPRFTVNALEEAPDAGDGSGLTDIPMIDANIVQIRGGGLKGDGSEGDPWGPA